MEKESKTRGWKVDFGKAYQFEIQTRKFANHAKIWDVET
jgi:hypothetical protein